MDWPGNESGVFPRQFMARKRTKVSRSMLFTWFMLAGFIFLFAPSRLTGKFQLAFNDIFNKPISMGKTLSLSVSAREPLNQGGSDVRYQNYIASLEEKLRIETLKVEKLSGLRQTHDWDGINFVIGQVSRASGASSTELLIDRGKVDSIAPGQYVLNDNSIIGIVSDVTTRAARVRLVTDPGAKISITIAGVPRLMEGAGNGFALIPKLSVEHQVKVDEPVFAAPRPGYLDSPVIVGRVAKCQRDGENPLLWEVAVKPVCDLEGMQSVAVMVPRPEKQ